MAATITTGFFGQPGNFKLFVPITETKAVLEYAIDHSLPLNVSPYYTYPRNMMEYYENVYLTPEMDMVIQELSRKTVQSLGLGPSISGGLYIHFVYDGTPMSMNGNAKKGDVITHMKLEDSEDWVEITHLGKVKVKYWQQEVDYRQYLRRGYDGNWNFRRWRQDESATWKDNVFQVTLVPSSLTYGLLETDNLEGMNEYCTPGGMVVMSLRRNQVAAQMNKRLQIKDFQTSGVVVLACDAYSVFAQQQLEGHLRLKGKFITSVNNHPIQTLKQFKAAWESAQQARGTVKLILNDSILLTADMADCNKYEAKMLANHGLTKRLADLRTKIREDITDIIDDSNQTNLVCKMTHSRCIFDLSARCFDVVSLSMREKTVQ